MGQALVWGEESCRALFISPKGLKDDCVEERKRSQDPGSRCAAAACLCSVIELAVIARSVVAELFNELVDYFLAAVRQLRGAATSA